MIHIKWHVIFSENNNILNVWMLSIAIMTDAYWNKFRRLMINLAHLVKVTDYSQFVFMTS